MDRAKPFDIPKRDVWEAYKRVRANQGAAGVDGQTIADFEADLSNNLYKLWNRLSSGSYMPPPVRRVDIPKSDGRVRSLGVPTVADRVAQMVVKRYLEPLVEPCFHQDSYGYRPGKSALEAVGVARQRCWRYDWVLDLDIRAFFDSIETDLLMRAVRRHTTCAWVLLYIERWLKAPVQIADGSLVVRERGTPQGGVINRPTILQKAILPRAGRIGCGECAVDAEHDIDVVLIDLDPLDQGADQLALHEPVDLGHAVVNPFGEVLEPADDQRQRRLHRRLVPHGFELRLPSRNPLPKA